MYQILNITLALNLALIPTSSYAFFLETTYASSDVPVTNDPSHLTGRQARQYREQLQQQYDAESSSSAAFTEESPSSPDVPTKTPTHYYDQSVGASSSYSSVPFDTQVSSTSSSPSDVSSTSTYQQPVPNSHQEEQDRLTLEELEEYANEAEENIEEQREKLRTGFTVTSTSSLGSPLTPVQREAILRRNVRTVDQLQLFARALAESDENVRQITMNDTAITISYRSKAKLFGFIPLHFLQKITVDSNRVSVDTPWWTFFAKDSTEEVVLALEDELTSEEVEVPDLQHMLQKQQQTLQYVTNTVHMIHHTAMSIIR